MYAPSDKMVDEYIAVHNKTYQPHGYPPFTSFLEDNLKMNNAIKLGFPNHLMLMLFTGPNGELSVW